MRLIKESGDEQTAELEAVLVEPLSFQLVDSYGTTYPNFPIEWSVIEGEAILSEPATVTDDTGRTSVTATLTTKGGRILVQAKPFESQSAAIFTLHALPGPPASVAVSSGDAQAGRRGQQLPNPLVALVSDRYANPIPGVAVAWQIVSGQGTLSAASSESDESGMAGVRLTLPSSFMSVGVEATVSGTSFKTQFTAEAKTFPFSQTWTFDLANRNAYQFDSSKIEFDGGSSRLIGSDQVDDDPSNLGFGGASASGVVYDPSFAAVRLATSSGAGSTAQMDSSWAPRWSNLVGYWRAEGSGGIPGGASIDATLGPTGTARNPNGSGLSFAAGRIGSSILLDGVDDWIDFGGDLDALDLGTSNLSVSAWVKSSAQSFTVISKSVSGPSSGRWWISHGSPFCGPDSGGTSGYWMGVEAGALYCTGSVPGLNDGKWHHVMGVWNRASNMSLYVDGVQRQSVAISAVSGQNLNSSAPFLIGASGNSAGTGPAPGSLMNGSIDEIAVWKWALSPSEVQTISSRQSARFSGTMTSRVMDGLSTSSSWRQLSWKSLLPFGKSLPDALGGMVQNETSSDYPGLVGSASSPGDNDLMSEIQGLWHFDEPSGTSAPGSIRDDSGMGLNATPVTGVLTGVPGRLNRGVSFPGVAGKGIFGSTPLGLSGNSARTIAFWIRPASLTGRQMIVGWGAARQGGMYWVEYNGPFGVPGSIYVGGYLADVFTTSGLPLNAWSHVVVVYPGDDPRNTQVFFNGIQQGVAWQASEMRQNVLDTAPGPIAIGYDSIQNRNPLAGSLDELAIWSRALGPTEVHQLYRRGANRILFQVRNCARADCSDDLAGNRWKGPDGTNQSYLSELNNSSVAGDGTGDVNAGLPQILLSQFTNPVSAARYFQYRAVLESDDEGQTCRYGGTPSWCSPELRSVSVGPAHFDASAPTIVGIQGAEYMKLSALNETLGSSCVGGVTYNIGLGASVGSANWYYWSGSTWVPSDGTVSQSSSANVISSNLRSVATQLGAGIVYFRVFLGSDGNSPCELKSLELRGDL